MPHGRSDARRNKSEDDITAEVLERFSATADPRLRALMLSLIGHLHAFVKDVQLTELHLLDVIEIARRTKHDEEGGPVALELGALVRHHRVFHSQWMEVELLRKGTDLLEFRAVEADPRHALAFS